MEQKAILEKLTENKSALFTNMEYVDKPYCEQIHESEYGHSAEIRQKVKFKGGVKTTDQVTFGDAGWVQEKELVTFVKVPENTTVETVDEWLEKNPNFNIVEKRSNQPVITELLQASLDLAADKQERLDQIAERQIIRNPDTHDTCPGKINASKGFPMYRETYLSKKKKGYIEVIESVAYLPSSLEEEWKESVGCHIATDNQSDEASLSN